MIAQNNKSGPWQLVGIIVITAILSSTGSGIVSGYLAAKAVADQVVRTQGERIAAIEVRTRAMEVQIEKTIEFRLSRLEGAGP